MAPRGHPLPPRECISPLSAYILTKTHQFLSLSVSKRPCQQLNNVKCFSGLRWQSVNISLSLCENVLTNRMLTGVNKIPTLLTLRLNTSCCSTYLRLTSDCQKICTFADDKEHPFPSPCTRGAYHLIIINFFFYYGKN